MRRMFSQKQIKIIVQEGIDNGEIVVSGGDEEVVAYEGTLALPNDVVMSDWSLHRAIKNGNILWVALVGRITNNSATSVSLSQLFTFILPEEISSHIFRASGKPCNETDLSSQKVLYASCLFDSTNKVVELRCGNANNFLLLMSSSQTINANDYKDIEMRLPIFLDIGTTE